MACKFYQPNRLAGFHLEFHQGGGGGGRRARAIVVVWYFYTDVAQIIRMYGGWLEA